MSTSQKPKKPSKQLIKPNLPNSCSPKGDAENSSHPPRKRTSNHGNSSQPSKKLKTKLGGEVLKPLTSVVNGGGSRSNSQTNGTTTVAGMLLVVFLFQKKSYSIFSRKGHRRVRSIDQLYVDPHPCSSRAPPSKYVSSFNLRDTYSDISSLKRIN